MAILHFNKVANLHVESIGAPTKPLTTFTVTETVPGTSTSKSVFTVTTITEAAGNLNYKGFSFNSALNERNFYIYFKVDGVDRDPSFGDREGRGITIASGTTDANIAIAINSFIALDPVLSKHFTSTVLGTTVTITNKYNGEAVAASDGSDTTFDWNSVSLTHCYAITGWVWESLGGGNVGSRLKRKKYLRFIVNLEDFDNSLSY